LLLLPEDREWLPPLDPLPLDREELAELPEALELVLVEVHPELPPELLDELPPETAN